MVLHANDGAGAGTEGAAGAAAETLEVVTDVAATQASSEIAVTEDVSGAASSEENDGAQASAAPSADDLRAALDLAEVYDDSLAHGVKTAGYQRYIVLHDTEGGGEPEDVVSYWVGNGSGVAAHFVVGKDGHIAQCVPLDQIAHHAGFGDTGHNALFGVEDESRDDKLGTTSIGSAYADYGMNSYSVGIEMVHMGGEGDYPEAQLAAVDALIAYIDAYYAKQGAAEPSTIIDHKDWRSGNSDTSAEFAGYLANYQDHRTHLAM